MSANCFICQAQAANNKPLSSPVGILGEPLGTCKQCNAFACGHHGARVSSQPLFHCTICAPSLVAQGPHGGGPTSPTRPGSRGPRSPGPVIAPLPELEFQLVKAQANEELRPNLDEAFQSPENLLRSYYGKWDFLEMIRQQFPGSALGEENLRRLAVAVAMIDFFEIKQEFIDINLQKDPMIFVGEEAGV